MSPYGTHSQLRFENFITSRADKMSKLIDEFVVFSDHHAHSFSYGAKPVQFNDYVRGTIDISSRVAASVDVLNQIGAYMSQHNIQTALFGGDLFHVRNAVPTQVYNLTIQAAKELAFDRFVYAIPGNHDYYDRIGEFHSLEMLKDETFFVVDSRVDWPKNNTAYCRSSCVVSAIPYSDDKKKIIKAIQEAAERPTNGRPHILLAHVGIQGATVGSNFVMLDDSDLSIDDIPYEKFTACFFGHYHQHQKLCPNGWYIGATHQHNWGDANTTRGFLHVKIFDDHVDVKQIETKAPKFWLFNSLEELEAAEVSPDDFVRVKAADDQADSVREVLAEKTYSAWEVVAAQDTKKSEEEATTYLSDLSMEKAVEAWVANSSSSLNKDVLTQIGLEILSDSQED